MKLFKTFVMMLAAAAAAALLLPVFLGGAAGSASFPGEANCSYGSSQCPILSSTAPAPALETSPTFRMFSSLQDFFIAFAEFFMEVLITFWSYASETARCIFGFFLISGFFFFIVGMISIRSWFRVWHRYVE